MAVDVAGLTRAWQQRWAACRPIGHELRGCLRQRWIRFHSLPESKRYAEAGDEYAEVLLRHNTLIGELAGEDTGVLVFTCAWSDGPTPSRLDDEIEALEAGAVYWTSVMEERDKDAEYWTHLYVRAVEWRTGVLDPLLAIVADDRTRGVIIASADLAWLYHPYDGGGDVIASSVDQRARMRETHRAWLSPHSHGL